MTVELWVCGHGCALKCVEEAVLCRVESPHQERV